MSTPSPLYTGNVCAQQYAPPSKNPQTGTGVPSISPYGTDNYVSDGYYRTLCSIMRPMQGQLASGWAPSVHTGALTGPATSTAQAIEIPDALLHDGATLDSVQISVGITTHSSLPANQPQLSFGYYVIGAPGTFYYLASGDPISIGAASVSAYNATTTLTYTCNQNHVINRAVNVYFAVLTDENGSNSIAGNAYRSIQFWYSAVPALAGVPVAFP